MKILWTEEARSNFRKIKSRYFSNEETRQYKKELAFKIQDKIISIMEAMPANEPEWKGSYRVLIDNYIVIYSFSEDRKICYIKAFKHQKQS
ncbi:MULTISPECIES: type II toxin-antitoxin system RelE/ParE family toxin [Bacillaceae]|uniref:Type II toxin-antitoxin system RelE/ParE family toxin n=1 Tax=Evansella alkalicola TaxID=745819 RepID=A0ABS6JZ30_9BACI|nr:MULTISPECIES: type II toxin-antitoxin system RelE/ParE family toxin [Bacillaceae]MBU9723834.1 type II toxin-antitoxin system RelE/ParE family toxin [Bacillus alkalicola]